MKIFENILYNQIALYFEKVRSNYHTVFRKDFNPQNGLIAMTENFRNSLDQRDKYAALKSIWLATT